MTAPQLSLGKLELSRSPGFSAPFSIIPDNAGLVLVVGPNESGKSSLARALFFILWPELSTSRAIEAQARFRFGDRDVQASLLHGQTHWTDERGETFSPGLPPKELAECFRLSVEDRGSEASSNRELAERIARALAGGYDLGAAREELAVIEPAAPGKLRKACEEAKRVVQGIEREQISLEDQERELETQRAQLAEGQRLEREEPLLAAALLAREARASLDEIGRELSALADCKNVTPRDLERLAAERADLEQREAELRDATVEWQAHCSRWRAHPFADREMDLAHVQARVEDARALEHRERDRGEAQLAFDQRNELARRWTQTAGVDVPLVPAPEELRDLEGLAAEWQAAQAELSAAKSLQAVLPSATAPAQAATSPARARAALWALAIACLLAGALAAYAFHPGFALLAVLGILGMLVAATQPRDGTAPALDPHASARNFAEARIRESNAKLEALKPAIERAEQRFGISPGLSLSMASDVLRRRAQTLEQVGVFRAALESAERDHDELRDALATFLAQHGLEPASSASGILAGVRALADDWTRCAELRDTAYEAEHARARTENALAETQRRIERIFTDAGVAMGDEAAMRKLVESRARYDELTTQQTRTQRDLEAALQQLGEVDEQSLGDTDSLRARIGAARERRENMRELQRTIQRIEWEVDQRRAQDVLEAARGELAQAEARLAGARESAIDAALAESVLDDVESDLQGGDHVPVLARAQELFGRFTRGRHTLQLGARNRDRLDFMARDHSLDRDVALDQLSSGTRVQLLLAARLAFALEEAERAGSRPPLILDEALATTDESRFGAVADAMAMLVDDGWQVIYLTSQRSDVERWRQRSLAAGAREPRVIDLAAVRRLEQAAEVEHLSVPVVELVPLPGASRPEDYARALNVPALDLERPLGEQHVFHLLRDELESVRELVVLQAGEVGIAERLATGGEGALGGLSTAQRDHLAARIALLRAFHELWSIGRGRPVDAQVLSDAGVTDVFLDDVAALARRHGGDAKRLIDALRRNEVKGFGVQKTAGLDQELQHTGHLQRVPWLSFEEVVWRSAERSKLSGDEVRELCTQWWTAAERAFDARRAESVE